MNEKITSFLFSLFVAVLGSPSQPLESRMQICRRMYETRGCRDKFFIIFYTQSHVWSEKEIRMIRLDWIQERESIDWGSGILEEGWDDWEKTLGIHLVPCEACLWLKFATMQVSKNRLNSCTLNMPRESLCGAIIPNGRGSKWNSVSWEEPSLWEN